MVAGAVFVILKLSQTTYPPLANLPECDGTTELQAPSTLNGAQSGIGVTDRCEAVDTNSGALCTDFYTFAVHNHDDGTDELFFFNCASSGATCAGLTQCTRTCPASNSVAEQIYTCGGINDLAICDDKMITDNGGFMLCKSENGECVSAQKHCVQSAAGDDAAGDDAEYDNDAAAPPPPPPTTEAPSDNDEDQDTADQIKSHIEQLLGGPGGIEDGPTTVTPETFNDMSVSVSEASDGNTVARLEFKADTDDCEVEVVGEQARINMGNLNGKRFSGNTPEITDCNLSCDDHAYCPENVGSIRRARRNGEKYVEISVPKKGLGGGAIAGIVIGSVVGAVVVGVLIYNKVVPNRGRGENGNYREVGFGY